MPGVSFDRAADYYDATRGFPAGVDADVCAGIVQATGSNGDTRFAELGVGTGRIALPFITAGYSYVGVDLSLRMMARLREKVATESPAGERRWGLVRADVTRLPLAAGGFDVAVAYHVLHLVDDWRATIRQARAILRPGSGQLVISGAGPDLPPSGPSHQRALTGPQRVRHRWTEIVAELGWEVQRSSGAFSLRGAAFAEFLAQERASVRSALLTEYDTSPMSPRAMADELIARLHSADWPIPDALHAEATRRLERWLATEIPAPDEPESRRQQEWGSIITWSGV